jgi:hypothetical protein
MIGSTLVSSHEDGLAKLAKHARVVLVFIAAFQLGAAALLWVAGGPVEHAQVVPTVIAGVVYGSLAVWARHAPMPAVATGFVLFVISVGIGVAQGGSIFEGLLLKVIVLALFMNGLGSARQYNEAKKRVANPPTIPPGSASS